MRLGKVHQTATRDGVKEWDLVAGSAEYNDAENQVEFKDVAATFFLKDNQEVSLNADRGVLQTDSRDMSSQRQCGGQKPQLQTGNRSPHLPSRTSGSSCHKPRW